MDLHCTDKDNELPSALPMTATTTANSTSSIQSSRPTAATAETAAVAVAAETAAAAAAAASLSVVSAGGVGGTASTASRPSAAVAPRDHCTQKQRRRRREPQLPSGGPTFSDLSRWIHFHILTFLDGKSVARFAAVCQDAKLVTTNGRIRGASLWEMLRAKEFPFAHSLATHNKLPYPALWTAKRDADPSHLRRLDFFGRWQGDSCIYNARVTLLPGRRGFELWRGSDELDAPFYVDSEFFECISTQPEALDAAYCFRPDLRPQWVYEQIYTETPTRVFWGNQDPRFPPLQECPMTPMERLDFCKSSRELLRQGKTWEQRAAPWGCEPPPTDGRIAVAGVIQWYLSELNSSDISERILQSSGGCRTGREYVSGLYFPQQRRILLQGSHKNSEGVEVIGLDRYDLFVSEDGLTMRGVTRGYDDLGPEGCWVNTFHGVAASFASSGALQRALDVEDPAQNPLPATGTLGEINDWIHGIHAVESGASADPDSPASIDEGTINAEFDFECVDIGSYQIAQHHPAANVTSVFQSSPADSGGGGAAAGSPTIRVALAGSVNSTALETDSNESSRTPSER